MLSSKDFVKFYGAHTSHTLDGLGRRQLQINAEAQSFGLRSFRASNCIVKLPQKRYDDGRCVNSRLAYGLPDLECSPIPVWHPLIHVLPCCHAWTFASTCLHWKVATESLDIDYSEGRPCSFERLQSCSGELIPLIRDRLSFRN